MMKLHIQSVIAAILLFGSVAGATPPRGGEVGDDDGDTSTTSPDARVKIPRNCTPNGGHDPYSGEPVYHCKQKDGTLRLCEWSDIRDKRPGCTAFLVTVVDPDEFPTATEDMTVVAPPSDTSAAAEETTETAP
ncbi:hypothetical protein BH09MYX1_BH09MYX1_48150 [soil metagenome]